jgi:hypothetical protein
MIEIEKNRKTIRKFLKTYETIAQANQVVPYASIVSKMNKIVKSEAGPLTLAIPVRSVYTLVTHSLPLAKNVPKIT